LLPARPFFLDGAADFLRAELDNWGRMVKAIGLTIR